MTGSNSVGSSSRKSGTSSVSSRISSASRKGLSMLFRPSQRSSATQEEAIWQIGDQCETLSLVTMRKEQALESEVLIGLPIGTTCEVKQVGEGRRIQVKAGDLEGWISSKTKMNEPLVAKCSVASRFAVEDFEVGGQHEVKSLVTVRGTEALDSALKTELQPGVLVKILELGKINKRRAKISSDSVEGWISMATKQGELLIGKVSDISDNKNRGSGFFSSQSSSKIKQVLEASRSGNLDAIKKIIDGRGSVISKFQTKPNLDCSDIRGKTPLIYAAAFGNRHVVEYLLIKQVDVNQSDDTQKSAMHHASKQGKRLREESSGNDFAQADIVNLLIQAKAFVEARDHNGCTALMFAVANGSEAVVRSLIAAYANVNVKDFEGQTPMNYALTFGHSNLAQLLKDAGARCLEEDNEDTQVFPVSSVPKETRVSKVDVEEATRPPATAVPKKPSVDEVNAVIAASVGCGDSQSVSLSPKKSVLRKKGSSASVKLCDADAGVTDASVTETVTKDRSVKALPKEDVGEASQSTGTAAKSVDSKLPEAEAKKKPTKKAVAKKAVKSAPKKDKALPMGMQEMVENLDGVSKADAQEIAVHTPKDDDVDEASVARFNAGQKLKAVMDSRSLKEVEVAIETAVAAGVAQEEIDAARVAVDKLKARAKAREDLRHATVDKDVAQLRVVIAAAQKHGISEDEIDVARKVLAEEEPKEKAREGLRAAEAGGDIGLLKEALVAAVSAGLSESELTSFREMLSCAESKEKGQQMLADAVANKDIAALKFAIKQAKDLGLDPTEAEMTLSVEEPKQKMREALVEACEACTKEALREAIDGAIKIGLPSEDYAEAASLLKQEEEKERLLGQVRTLMDESKDVNTTCIDSMSSAKAKLSEAIRVAKEAGVPESMLADAEQRRRRIHNGIEDLKGSIRVFCRVRPLSSKEVKEGDTECTKLIDSMTVAVEDSKFSFDAVFAPGKQEDVFEDCRDLVQSAVDGYNVTMFAYGQTGAGKTFTMYGVPGMLGTAPRTIDEVFRVVNAGKDRYHYTLRGAMLELYLHDFVDLLVKDKAGSKGKLNVRTDKKGMVQVEHLTEEEVSCPEELAGLLDRGTANRSVASTVMNADSSRSHLVFIIKIDSVNRETQEMLQGKIIIVDLAGSERLKKTQTAEHAQKESIEINKSLTALGDVIEALTKGSKQIPYRNHKLTQLMQDSLGGTAKTLMFVNCSPANSNVEETLTSLKYATRAKQIKNTATKKAGPTKE
eukprot:TRINITY_DN9024_c0_g1_i1.p1 TRINITY_DN9024_c0_g1~~TRINITY_DN9024_c0_g1_i1.p1  ORF type:complete len:1293 (+),score=335.19 TRINITY_DN9024_c0_g1_i1:146-3880(+)